MITIRQGLCYFVVGLIVSIVVIGLIGVIPMMLTILYTPEIALRDRDWETK